MKVSEMIATQQINKIDVNNARKNFILKEEGFTFIDLFAGIGGFHIALHNLGGTCVFASECNIDARETYEANLKKISPELFTNNMFAGDITQINPHMIPDHDVLCAGFPCQPFSISGKKQGFEDTRGTLFFNVLEIIKVKRPKVVLLENVKHLMHHNSGQTLKVIINSLENIGYVVSYQVLNAKDFGLAQNRERIVIIAHKEREFDFSKLYRKSNAVIRDVVEVNDTDFEYLNEDEYTILPKELWRKQSSGLIFCGYRNKTIRTVGVRENTKHLSRTHKQPNRIYYINGTHPTLPSQESTGRFWIYDGMNVRKLTIKECYQLQGFPEYFKINDKKSSAYIQVGNAVAVPMIEEIMKAIKEQLLCI